MEPKFRKRGDGRASLFDSEEAKRTKGEKRPWSRAQSPDKVNKVGEDGRYPAGWRPRK